MNHPNDYPIKRPLRFFVLFFSAILLLACGEASETGSDNNGAPAPPHSLSLDIELPDSMTGGATTVASALKMAETASSGTGLPCAFVGADGDDPFRNGYQMTRFMVSAVATWTCFADVLIELADHVEGDGEIYETNNDPSQPDYDPEDPTHYSVTADSDTQTTIRFYYGYNRSTPPTKTEDPQFFISWDTPEEGHLEGRLIIDGRAIDAQDREDDDPAIIRMDFDYSDTQKDADMYLRFDDNNFWAEGLRIRVTKDLTASSFEQVFVAVGMIEMKDQFLPTGDITEIPIVHMYTVSDGFGNGAAIADFEDLSLPLILNLSRGNHLGNYLFTKEDIYFFDDAGDWDWIHKTIINSEYRGGRTTPATGGTWTPFDPSLDLIATELDLGADYFSVGMCAETGDDCTDLLNAVFEDGFSNQEPNQGADPMDWRSNAIANPTYLDSVYPNGTDWSGAFDFIFTP